jgi:hypothetical protein
MIYPIKPGSGSSQFSTSESVQMIHMDLGIKYADHCDACDALPSTVILRWTPWVIDADLRAVSLPE